MTTIVMGGGIIGVTTAYYLNTLGEEVIVLERNRNTGEETSFQNGALLAPGHSHSWANPGAAWTLLKSIFQEHPAVRFKFSFDPQLWRWVFNFLPNCTEQKFTANTLRTFRCMNEGLSELRTLCAETGIQYDGNDHGILYLFRSEHSFEQRKHDWTLLQDRGLKLEQVSAKQCAEIEPTLQPVKHKIGGGFFSPDEAAGDAFVFTQELARYCAQQGVEFRYSTSVKSILTKNGQVTGIHTDKEVFSADHYVLALGPYAPIFTKPIGIHLPIWPVKGYTITIPIASHHEPPRVGVIEEDNLVSFAHLGDRFRIGSEAEFAGYDRSYVDTNFHKVLSVSKDLFPNLGDYTQPRYWACLRPVSAGGPPILGETPISNLFLNVGHGAAGWTEACATSRAVAEIVSGQTPTLNMEGLRLSDL